MIKFVEKNGVFSLSTNLYDLHSLILIYPSKRALAMRYLTGCTELLTYDVCVAGTPVKSDVSLKTAKKAGRIALRAYFQQKIDEYVKQRDLV